MKIQCSLRDISGRIKNKMDRYKTLKEQIIKEVNNLSSLEEIKRYYKGIIKSNRKLNRVKTLNDIFHLLEERDALDCNNIAVLKHLGTLLQNTKINNHVNYYEKLHVEPETCICGKSKIVILPIINPRIPEIVNSEENESNELQTAVNNIALNIGKKWRILASELHVKECYVDEVREKYPDDFQAQAQKILEIWIKSNSESATIKMLKKALNSRLCKIKGVGLHMLKPPITVE